MFHCVMGLMIFYVAAKQTCFPEGANRSDEYYLGGGWFVGWLLGLLNWRCEQIPIRIGQRHWDMKEFGAKAEWVWDFPLI